MIRNFLSRFHPRYLRVLVYMMQASEYYVGDYLHWYHNTKDFSIVEHRKQLVYTWKAWLLLVAGWVLVAAILSGSVVGLVYGNNVIYAVSGLVLLCSVFILPYLMILPLWIINALQWPLEQVIIAKAKNKLAGHKGIRIAIAGSYGKTSMREILKTVLAEGKKVSAPGGSHNTPLAIAKFIDTLSGDEEIIIFELGEYYPGDIKKLCQMIRPEWGIITGVNEAHLARFGTLAAARATIFELADYLGGKPLYINKENELAFVHASQGTAYDRRGAGAWHIESATTGLDGTTIVLTRGKDRIQAHSEMLGLHNVGPLVACADIATRLGFTPAQIGAGIAKTRPFAHRMQPSATNGVTTIDDSYNGNPDGVRAAIEFLAGLPSTRRWYVTPGLVEMGPRTREVHEEIGKELSDASIEKIVLIRNSVTPFIAEGVKKGKFNTDIVWFDDALLAYRSLPNMTAPGDVVLMQNDWPDQYF